MLKLVYVFLLHTFLSAYVVAEVIVQDDEVLIEAARPAADNVDTEFTTGWVSVINNEEFGSDLATVADVIKKQPGIQIRQHAGLGSFSTVNIRGAASSQVNVYLDGILVNGAHGGIVDLSQFLLSSIESIEIYRGKVPVQLGRSAIGGAIHIKSKRFSDESKGLLTISGGSYSTRKASLSGSAKLSQTSVIGSLEYLASENDYGFHNNNLTPLNSTDDFDERRNNNDVEQFSALLSSTSKIDDAMDLQLVLQGSDKHKGIPEASNSIENNAYIDTDFVLAKLKLNHVLSQTSSLSYSLAKSYKKEYYNDRDNKVGLEVNEDDSVTNLLEGGVQLAHSIGAHLLNVNVELRREDFVIDDFVIDDESDFVRNDLMIGLQDEWVSSDGRLLLSLAGRALYIDDHYDYINDEDTRVKSTDSDWHSSVQAGLLWTINQSLSLQANISRDIRIPELKEKFGDQGTFEGNDELVNESALNFDLGGKYKASTFEAAASYFYRDLDDAIVWEFNSRGIGQADNFSKARIQGVELEGKYTVNSMWDIAAATTSIVSEDLSASRSSGGNQLPGLYEFSAYLSNSIRLGDLSLNLEYHYQSGGNYDAAATTPMPDISQFNLLGAWQNGKRTVEVDLMNLTDEISEEFNRSPGPGRRLFITYKQEL